MESIRVFQSFSCRPPALAQALSLFPLVERSGGDIDTSCQHTCLFLVSVGVQYGDRVRFVVRAGRVLSPLTTRVSGAPPPSTWSFQTLDHASSHATLPPVPLGQPLAPAGLVVAGVLFHVDPFFRLHDDVPQVIRCRVGDFSGHHGKLQLALARLFHSHRWDVSYFCVFSLAARCQAARSSDLAIWPKNNGIGVLWCVTIGCPSSCRCSDSGSSTTAWRPTSDREGCRFSSFGSGVGSHLT